MRNTPEGNFTRYGPAEIHDDPTARIGSHRLLGHVAATRVRHDSELGFWESTSREPAPRLRGLIKGPYQGWVEKTSGTMVRREVPSGIIPIIINLGPAYGLIDPTGCTSTRYLGSFVAGLHESFAMTESGSYAICVQMNMSPLGAYQFLGVPMHSLANLVIELEDILGKTVRRVIAQMQDVTDWETRFAMLDEFITNRVRKQGPPSPGFPGPGGN